MSGPAIGQRQSMRSLITEQIVASLKAATAGRQSVLVFDDDALCILEAVMNQPEVLALGYRVLVKLEPKQPSLDPDLDGEPERTDRRFKYHPLPVVYFMRATDTNARWLALDYGTGVSTEATPGCMERCFPCIFSGIDDAVAAEFDTRPWYKDAGLILLPGGPGGEAAQPVLDLQRFLRARVEADPGRFAPLTQFASRAVDHPQVCLPEIIALEDDLFTTNQPDTIKLFYSGVRRRARDAEAGFGMEAPSVPLAQVDAFLLAQLSKTAWRLASLLISLNELPKTRFFQSSAASLRGHSGRRCWSGVLADLTMRYIQEWWTANPWWQPIGFGGEASAGAGVDEMEHALHGDTRRSAAAMQPDMPRERSTMLVLERLDDLSTVLVHDLTYQCAVQDMLGIAPAESFAVTDDGSAQHRLDEADYVWQKVRNQHLLDANTAVVEGMGSLRRKQKRRAEAKASSNVRRLAEMALEQEFQRGKRWDHEYQVHEILVGAVLEHVHEPGVAAARRGRLSHRSGGGGDDAPPTLLEMAELEMSMVCSGISTHDSHIRTPMRPDAITKELNAFMTSPRAGPEEKARLYLLWLLTQPALTPGSNLIPRSSLEGTRVLAATDRVENLGVVLSRRDDELSSGMVHTISSAAAKQRTSGALAPDGSSYVMGYPIYLSRAEVAAASVIHASSGKPPPVGAPEGARLLDGLPVDQWGVPSVTVSAPAREPGPASSSARAAAHVADEAGIEMTGVSAAAAAASASSAAAEAGGGDGDEDDGDEDDAFRGKLARELDAVGGGGRRGAGRRKGGTAAAAAKGRSAGPPKRKGGDVYERADRPRLSGPRLVVFVLGGVTPQEQAALARLSAATGREIVVGGTSLLSASGFLEQLEATGDPGIEAEIRGGAGGGSGGKPAARR